MTPVSTFDLTAPLPHGRLALEASAGTGKTYTIAGLVVRYVAEGVAELDQLLVVTFTRAATAELRERIRRRLADAAAHLDLVLRGAQPDHPDDVIALLAALPKADARAALERLQRALANFDAATITTIHGFCHQVLATAGFAGDVDGAANLVEEVDDLVAAVTHDLLVRNFGPAGTPQDDRPSLNEAGPFLRLALADPAIELRPDADDDSQPAKARAVVRLAQQARRVVDDRKRAHGLLTFDDLLNRLRTSLHDPAAASGIVATMRHRYRVALIDEFQDTDPVQWEILRTLFGEQSLVLIGDPKQAIYKFRGADIHAYLEATSADGTRRQTLATNWRSDARLVDVTNRLFNGTRFGDDQIIHRDMAAAPDHADDRLVHPGGAREVFQVRVVTETRADPARSLIAQDLAAEVTRLLASGATITTSDGVRDVAPGDCAVLVRTNAQAEAVQSQLQSVGVHAVVGGVGSVLETPAALDWGRLLDALDRPGAPGRVRALALCPLVGATAAEVGDADDLAEAELHDRAHRWSQVLRDHGIAALLRTIARETHLVQRLLGQQGGERHLTDIEHVGTLLQGAMAGERRGPAALHAWLVEQGQRTDELPADQRARRLESDAHAVQILTIHRSKGLQFPVVFCPDVMGLGGMVQAPWHHHDPDLRRSVVDAGGNNQAAAKLAVSQEAAGEALRLMYVAMTRAEHRCVVWWFPYWNNKYRESPLTQLLFNDRAADPRVTIQTKAPAKPDDALLADWFDTAVAALGPAASWERVADQPQPVPWAPAGHGLTQLTARTFLGSIDLTWRRTSYSGLIRPRDPATDAADGPNPSTIGAPDGAPGHDDDHDTEPPQRPDPGDGRDVPLPLHDQEAGARFGSFVHEVMERVDLAAPDLAAELRREVDAGARRAGLALADPSGLAAGLALACATPLGAPFGNATLEGTARSHRLDELDFELPVPAHSGAVTLAAIADLLDDHLPDDDPFVAYGPRLRDPALARRVRGFLGGSIDLVLRRVGDDGQPRFHVIDHKTNRTYPADTPGSAWHYRRDALVEAMLHGHYPLQALLYQVAIHRFLRWRLPDYAPQRHLGAAGYLFLRGMIGPDAPIDGPAPCGVMTWEIPTSLVLATSTMLETGR